MQITNFIEKRINKITYSNSNKKEAARILIETLFIAAFYCAYCTYFFHGVWYLNIFIGIVTLISGITYINIRLEMIRKKFRKDSPKTVRKIKYYLIHTKDISRTLEKTIKKIPDTTKKYLEKIQSIIDGENPKEKMNKFKKLIDLEWVIMICNIVMKCKESGDSEKIISQNLEQATYVIEITNEEQELDNIELLWMQALLIVVPLVGIPYARYFSQSMFQPSESIQLYQDTIMQIKSAKIIFLSNLFSLFINWIRNNQ